MEPFTPWSFFDNKENKYLLACHVKGLKLISRASSLNYDTNYICLYRSKIRSNLYLFKVNEQIHVRITGNKTLHPSFSHFLFTMCLLWKNNIQLSKQYVLNSEHEGKSKWSCTKKISNAGLNRFSHLHMLKKQSNQWLPKLNNQRKLENPMFISKLKQANSTSFFEKKKKKT